MLSLELIPMYEQRHVQGGKTQPKFNDLLSGSWTTRHNVLSAVAYCKFKHAVLTYSACIKYDTVL